MNDRAISAADQPCERKYISSAKSRSITSLSGCSLFGPKNYSFFADKADADWEQATTDYRQHVRKIGNQLPGKLRELAEFTCLHDAVYLGYQKVPVPKSSAELAVVAVQKADDVSLLIYVLAEQRTLSAPHGADVFSRSGVHWLYDEVDATSGGMFSHETLLSSGKTLSVKFVAFDMLTVNKGDFNTSRPDRIPAEAT